MKNKQKGFIIPLIIVIVALLVVSGVYIYVNKKVESPTVSNTVSPQSNQTAPIVATSDKSLTDNWKTYKNDIYGFEVQYPSNGFLTGDNYRFSKDINDYVVEIRIPSPQSFMIEVTSQKNLSDFSKSSVALAKQNGGITSNISVAGVPAIKIVNKYQSGDEYRSVLFVKNGNGYYINLIGPGFDDSEKMLKTFKFTK